MMNLKDYLNSSKLLIKTIIKSLVICLLFLSPLSAQQDSLTSSEQMQQEFVMEKSPWGAVLRSAVIPGWGQLYNQSYWKVPVVLGITGWLVYGYIYSNNKYVDFRQLYLQTNDDNDLSSRNFYRDQRDLFAIYIGIAYLLNLIDAYVDAHLFDFTVEENYQAKHPMFGLRINF